MTDETDVGATQITLRDGMLGVPAAVIAGPGILVLLWIGLQSVGTMAWAPAVTRLRGEDEERPRARGESGRHP